jgi:beta-barrel assembly-enhancing protease
MMNSRKIQIAIFMGMAVAGSLYGGWLDVVNNKDKIISAVKVVKKTSEASKDIPPHQSYQVGRNFAARAFAEHPPIKDEDILNKVNLIGQALALHSAQPEIFAGYSFTVLDTEAPNGFSTPGGHVFITKGLLDLCENDHHIAAILAHEIAHVAAHHGTALIKKMRWTDTALTAGTEVMANSNSDSTANLAKGFGDIGKNLFTSVAKNGFGRRQELEADGLGVLNLKAAGFRPEAMIEMLEKVEEKFGKLDIPLFESHNRPEERIAHVKVVLETNNPLGHLSEEKQ